jgi:hypothetical protein
MDLPLPPIPSPFPAKLPEVVAEEPETRESKRRKCAHGKHNDRLVRGGKRLECTTCGDSFPCLNTDCGHFDCQWERDEPGAAICGELGHVKE